MNIFVLSFLFVLVSGCSGNRQSQIPSSIEERIAQKFIATQKKSTLKQLSSELPISFIVEEALPLKNKNGDRFFLAAFNTAFLGKIVSVDLVRVDEQGQIHKLGAENFTENYAFFKDSAHSAKLQYFGLPPQGDWSPTESIYTLQETQLGTQGLTRLELKTYEAKVLDDIKALKVAQNDIDTLSKKSKRLFCPLDKDLICKLRPY